MSVNGFRRVSRSGEFEAGRDVTPETATAIVAALTAFAADPEAVGAAYRERSGCCCLCSTPPTNKLSIELGYSPICADRYGLTRNLPWADSDDSARVALANAA